MALRFEILARDAASNARVGRVHTPHGAFDTPAFMPVGTRGSVKGLLPGQLADLGAQVILANTYHLMLRPGSDLIARMGGLQKWTGWGGPMLTDSGGFQVFSLADLNRITDQGVTFKSHLDGATIELTPARSIQVQNELGADIIMAFDDCPPAESSPAGSEPSNLAGKQSAMGNRQSAMEYDQRVRAACDRTARWLEQCIAAHARPSDQALFGIVQGGTDLDARRRSVEQVCAHDLPGFAIGGVAVGEGFDQLVRVVDYTAPLMPWNKPRYLMGVGYERDIVAAVKAGVDMFDCVLPTRNGRTAHAFTRTGPLKLKNARYAEDERVIEEDCDCLACGGVGPGAKGQGRRDLTSALGTALGPRPMAHGPFSRSYLRHLFMAGEMLGPILVSAHNIRHFERLVLDIRRAIADNNWSYLHRRWPVVD